MGSMCILLKYCHICVYICMRFFQGDIGWIGLCAVCMSMDFEHIYLYIS